MGTAGLGKSRLVAEFLAASSRGTKALRGRCLSYGEGITFWPLAEVAKEAALISEQDTAEEAMRKLTAAVGTDLDAPLVAERIASVIGLSGVSHALQETFWAARKFLEALARDWPLVVVFDDIHWAESTLLDMIEHLVEFGDAPVLLVCAARPELLEARPGWGRDLDLASTITLRPLSEDESDEMLRSILGGVELPPEARAGMMAAAGGNPLFVEQILAMWIDQGLLRPEGGRFVLSTSVPEHPIPATISALLGARLDRLSREERDLIERASVVGLVFYGGAVVELSREETRGRVWRDLVSLVDKDLVHPDDSTFTGEDAYRFSHVLIRDAAYAGILKRVRADLHERFAAWLERVSGDRARELEEIVGYHLEQAFRYRTELRPTMPDDHALAARASERLASAGMRASARSDTGAVANLLSRAADLLPADEPRRLELLPDLAFALTEIGEYERARALIADAAEKAAAAGDRRLEAHAIMARLLLLEDTEPEGWPERTRHEIEGVFRSLHEAGDHLGLAKAWGVMTSVHWWEGRYDLAAEATLREVEFARKAGAEHLEVRALANYCFAAFYGTTPVVEAIERCEALLDRAKTLPRLRHAVLFSLAGLKAMAGEFDRARELAAKIRPMAVDLGMRINAATASQSTAFVEMLAGNPRGAEQELTDDYRALEALGEKVYLATIAAMLAECLYTQGRHDEAGAYAEISEKGAAPDDLDVQARWRGVRAKLLARAGRFEEADRLAREAVEITTRMDFPNAHGDALLDLCEVLHLAGRMDDAMAAASEGRAAYERKGNVSSAQRALSSIERMPGAGTRTGPPGS
jgi:tetratricopeptide (TPR) repeat protein